MDVEFFTILDHEDDTIPTVVFRPSQILGDIIDTKTSGKYISKVYKPNLPESHRIYTYNFKTQKVELDEITAIEQIEGSHDCCELSTYKTMPVTICTSDNIATVDRTAGYKLKFSNSSDLLSTKGLAILQVENYAIRNDSEDAIIDINDDMSFTMMFDSGLMLGHWLGLGKIENINGQDATTFYPKTEDDTNIISAILISMFPEHEHLLEVQSYGRSSKVIFNSPEFSNWISNTHSESETKEIPFAYYSASTTFVSGLFYGLMMTVGRYSMNHRKKVMYYTFSSISESLITNIIELLNIYASTHAKKTDFVIEKTQRRLFLANIRVTEDVLDNLSISSFVDGEIDMDYIPKANRHTLKRDDNVIVITRMTVEPQDKCDCDYIIYLKNSSSIIGTTGMIHQSKCSG